MSAARSIRRHIEVNNEVAAYERQTREIEASFRAALLMEQAQQIAAGYAIVPEDDHMLLVNRTEQDDWAMVYRVPGTTDVDRDRTMISHRTPFLARAFEIVIEARVEANRKEREAAHTAHLRKAAA
ncbi:MAG: hypothetical protein ABIY70_08850 [Capsulimonas sp.]|uniref:hypothetical protein n=1 Tax=Capsulimonas sp. TaxID=2494211 RepID=UPI003264AA95